MDDILKDKSLVSTITDGNVVSKECFISEHPLSIFRYLNCACKTRFANLFKPYNIDVDSDADVMALASMSEKGIDVKQFGVSFMSLAKNLVLTDKEIGNAQCLIFC